MLREWLSAVEKHYRSVVWRSVEEPSSYPNEVGPKHWTEPRFEQIMRLKQEALAFARGQEAGYILQGGFLSCLFFSLAVDGPPMSRSKHLHVPPKHPTKIGFDEVFLINLARRPDRRERMLEALFELEIDPLVVDAIDGRALNSSSIKKLGIDLLPGYYDPFSGRTLTKGEVGCFLSHHHVWKEVVERGLEKSLVLEDDIRFEAYFKRHLAKLMDALERTQLDWDLIYLGRKQVNSDKEEEVVEIPNLVVPEYSYWTFSTAILHRFITKLGAEMFLCNQERFGYINVPMASHQTLEEEQTQFVHLILEAIGCEDYKKYFRSRDLRAFSVQPYLAYPAHYAGDAEWMSDTEFSTIWDDDSQKTAWSGSQKTLKDARGISHGGYVSRSLPTAARDEL
ncbi:probable inactive glycosyltransferase 25 family member 3 [Protobothrops mucrosquamatus]|uniref:probable inactive glycosyltransferase 25 family member 3 n=1 Tax=Protobothrops mucrosquamatus TaxID=103944 RepID=UPI000775EE4D|nr:probable inactive glycosyltransferase 25 family member 3 [Protobothrops mucrosquamatus]